MFLRLFKLKTPSKHLKTASNRLKTPQNSLKTPQNRPKSLLRGKGVQIILFTMGNLQFSYFFGGNSSRRPSKIRPQNCKTRVKDSCLVSLNTAKQKVRDTCRCNSNSTSQFSNLKPNTLKTLKSQLSNLNFSLKVRLKF